MGSDTLLSTLHDVGGSCVIHGSIDLEQCRKRCSAEGAVSSVASAVFPAGCHLGSSTGAWRQPCASHHRDCDVRTGLDGLMWPMRDWVDLGLSSHD